MKKTKPRKRVKTARSKFTTKTTLEDCAAASARDETSNASPTPEWLVQTAIQLLPKYQDNDEPRELQWVAAILDAKRGLRIARSSVAIEAQWQEHATLAQSRIKVLEQQGLTEVEIKQKRVNFQRGCKFITGETKRLRAIQKWRAAAPTLYRLFQETPELIPNHEKDGFSLEDLVSLRSEFADLKMTQRKNNA